MSALVGFAGSEGVVGVAGGVVVPPVELSSGLSAGFVVSSGVVSFLFCW